MNTFEKTVSVCAHQVALRFFGFDSELNEDLMEDLEKVGEERASEMIGQGYVEGELVYFHPMGDEEIRGWWEIKK